MLAQVKVVAGRHQRTHRRYCGGRHGAIVNTQAPRPVAAEALDIVRHDAIGNVVGGFILFPRSAGRCHAPGSGAEILARRSVSPGSSSTSAQSIPDGSCGYWAALSTRNEMWSSPSACRRPMLHHQIEADSLRTPYPGTHKRPCTRRRRRPAARDATAWLMCVSSSSSTSGSSGRLCPFLGRPHSST